MAIDGGRRKGWAALAASVAVFGAAVGISVVPDVGPAGAVGGAITVVSTNPIFLGRGITPRVSADGRFIAGADLNGGGVRIGEPTAPAAVQVALNGQGQVANNAFNAPGGLSADGRHVVIFGEADNLTPTDNTRNYRAYTLDRDADGDGVFDEAGATTLRRIPGRVAAGAPSNGRAFADISNSGRFVAFTQPDVNGANNCLRAYRLDRDVDGNGIFDEPGGSAVVDATVSSAGVPGSRAGGCALGISDTVGSMTISGDGRYVAFRSDFDNLVPGDTNNQQDVFVRDVVGGTTIRTPGTSFGGPPLADSYLGGISDDGRFVATIGTDGSGPSARQVHRVDRDTDVDGIFDEPGQTAVTVVSSGTNDAIPSISGDGGTVAFWSPTGVKVWRANTGLVTVLPVTVQAGGETALNASGNVLALSTREVYDAADANGLEDVYRVELTAGPPVAVNVAVSSSVATTPPAATEIPIATIPPSTIRTAGFDVAAAPGGGVKRAPGGGVKRAPGGGVKRAPGGGVKRAPGGGVKRADELSRFAAAFQRVPAIWNLPLSAVPIDGGWESRLGPLAGRPLQSLTFGQVVTAIGPASVQLEQLDLTNTPLVNLSSAAIALGNTPLNQLLVNSSTGWCARLLQLSGRSCLGAPPTAIGGFTTQTTLIELELRADTAQILADYPELHQIPIRTNLAALRTAAAPVLQESFASLGLGVSQVGDLPIATAIAATPGIGSLTVADIGNTALTLDCVAAACPPEATLSALQSTGQIQARARLRDFTTAIGTKTLDDVAAVLPADVDLNDVLIGLLEAKDFPWEALDLVTSGIQEAVPGASTVAYTAQVTAQGGVGPFDGTVNIALPVGWRYRPGSASITPAPALPLTSPILRYSRTESTVGFTVTGLAAGTTYTITFDALPGFVLGTVAAGASAQIAGVAGSAAPAPVTIVEPGDAAGDAGTAPVVQADRLYVSYVTNGGDVDLFRFNPPPGKVVSVWLSNFERDADLTLYGPPTDAAGQAGSPSNAPTRAAAPTTPPLADEGTTAVGGALIAEPQRERDLPSIDGRTVVGTSANADVDVEGASAVNANLIQISAYQGATSTGPYLLRVRTDDTNEAAACAYTRSGGTPGPALDVAALPADLETAILVHQERLGDAMGAAAAQDLIDNWLTTLAGAPGAHGGLVFLDQAVDTSALEADWCSPDAANDVVRQVGQVISSVRAARPGLRHVVIVGGDDVIPMARIDDVTRTGNESEYAQELLDGNGGTTTPLTEALGTRHFLTDDPYGDLDPIGWFDRRLYVPDLAVGRLVETHDEIVATVQAYLDPNGDGNQVDAGVMTPSATYVTGYDFMADGATQALGALNASVAEATGATPATGQNITPPDGPVTGAQVIAGVTGRQAVGLFGHFSHDGALSDVGHRFGTTDGFTPDQLATALRPAGAPAGAKLVFSVGCHSGLNVADGLPGSTDFAQRVAGTGAVYVAMSTYGYGAQGVVGLNEQLMTSFADQLDGGYVRIDPGQPDTPANRQYLSLGEAFVAAKQSYFSGQGLYGPYDEKSLEAATFYGLPMFRIGQAGTERAGAAPATPTAVADSSYSAVDRSLTFTPSPVTTASGTYYTVDGLAPQVAANRPVQPRFETDVTASDGAGNLLYAKGVVVTDLDTAAAPTIDPVVTRPVLDSSTSEPELAAGDIAYPSLPAAVTTYTDLTGLPGDAALRQRQKLVVIPGQFLANATIDAAGDGTQVLYGKVDARVTYSASTDWDRPSISGTTATIDGGSAGFTVDTSDAAGVQRVLVLFRTPSADWAPLDLAPSGGSWTGNASIGAETTLDYLVQVVDANGNVATATGKGRGLDPFVAPTPDPALVSVGDASAPEGDSGSTNTGWTVSLDRPAPGPISVAYTIAAGTASLTTDASAANGTVVIPTGELTAAIPLSVLGDTTPEAPETVRVTLGPITGAGTPGRTTATLTILDDDAQSPPQILVNIGDAAPVTELNTGTTTTTLPVSLSAAATSPIVLSWQVVAGGTASVFADVGPPIFGSVTIPIGATSATIPLIVNGDTTVEGDETAVVMVTTTSGPASVIDATGIVTIVDDDVLPTVSVADVTAVEGSGEALVTFTLSAPSATPVQVPFTTGDATAHDPGDYSGLAVTTTISANTTTRTISLPIVDDDVYEPTESFAVTIGTPVGATVADGTAVVTITDDDPLGISVLDTTTTEGDAPGTVGVTVQLDRPSSLPVVVAWTTADGTAQSPGDYTASGNSITITGSTTGTISVPIVGDDVPEATEAFPVHLTLASVGTIADGTATVTVLDDDTAATPTITVLPATVTEGTGGTVLGSIPVTISPATTGPVTVGYSFASGTADLGDDLLDVAGTLSIPAGATSATVPVTVVADDVDEADLETFSVTLDAPTGSAVLAPPGSITVSIADDDATPVAAVVPVTLTEPATATPATFTVTLAHPSQSPISLGWATGTGSATAGSDYDPASGTLVIAPFETSATFAVTVRPDTLAESSETVPVTFSSPVGVVAPPATTLTIVDDDGASPQLSAGDVRLLEGSSGSATASVRVTLTRSLTRDITFTWRTANGTAVAPGDYTAQTPRTATIRRGSTSVTLPVTVRSDTLDEGDESFQVLISAASTGATISDAIGDVTIVDDDPRPTVSIADAAAIERNFGRRDMVFTVTLSAPNGETVRVAWATRNGTATNADFRSDSGTVVFRPGQTVRTVSVGVNGDRTREPNETFRVTLSSPSGATIARGTATGTIINDD